MDVRVHCVLKGSRANGPGLRNVVWFQGCTLHCPGCFNPDTHDPKGGTLMPVPELTEELLSGMPEGITISGGEPFQQPAALLELLDCLKERNAPPVLVFSGYPEAALREDRERAACLRGIDALICGPYMKDSEPAYERFCSSENQQLVLLSNRLTAADFQNLPLTEVIIDPSGRAVISGILQ